MRDAPLAVMTTLKLERWVYAGIAVGLAASGVSTLVLWALRRKPRVQVVVLPDAVKNEEALDEPALPTLEELLADSDTFSVLESPAPDEASAAIDDDGLLAEALDRN